MKILAIETSCDETAVSIAEDFGAGVKILSNVVSSQIELHKKYGGVVPEVAAREHVLNIIPVIDKAINDAGLDAKSLTAIAVTKGPGLMTSLQTGVETAKSLAYAWNLPLIEVNHIEGHIYANYIDIFEDIKLPAIILTVSGGHTMINLMSEHGDFEILGETRDDAAGEAFDKAAKLMNLGYPGGPAVSACAENFQFSNINNNLQVKLPRPMLNSGDYDFSFSGLKTAIRYAIRDDKDWESRTDEYCYEIQEAIVETLVTKTIKAAKEYVTKTVMLAGGVSANKRLREVLAEKVKNNLVHVDFVMPDLKYTTDNAAMIASAAIYKAKRNNFADWRNLTADCNLEFVPN